MPVGDIEAMFSVRPNPGPVGVSRRALTFEAMLRLRPLPVGAPAEGMRLRRKLS
jgi:hypothetical protein